MIASLISSIAVICGTPIPAIIRVVQIEPGPIPTLTASTPAFTRSNAPSGVATLPPITSMPGNSFLIILIVSTTFFEWPCALSITNTSTPASLNAFARSRVSDPVPSAAPTIKLPESSLVASGCSADFSISFIVTSPLSIPNLSITNTFSIRFSCISFFTESCGVPSTTVISSSNGVMIEETKAPKLSAYLKSLLVTIPFNLLSSTTGIPEIFSSVVS